MAYYDLMLAAVPSKDREIYEGFCRKMADVFTRHGATGTADIWGDDIPDGEVTSLPMAVKCGADETVVAGWVLWPDKATRDAGWKTAMEDPEMQGDMPMDGKRMIFGGFEGIAGT